MNPSWIPSQLLDYGVAGAVIFAQFGWSVWLLHNNRALQKDNQMLADKIMKQADEASDRMERLVDKFVGAVHDVQEVMVEVKTHLMGLNGHRKPDAT